MGFISIKKGQISDVISICELTVYQRWVVHSELYCRCTGLFMPFYVSSCWGPRRISHTHTLSIVGRKINRKKRKREKCRGWLGETDNNYTCPRRPREPDHVAMETQVQQKVTGKSIQIELISPSLLLPLSLFTPFSATKHASSLNHSLTIAVLMRR